MSLVEKALNKMRDTQRPSVSPVREEGAVRAMPESAARQPPPAPARTLRIDRQALVTQGLLPPPHEEKQSAQQYRKIKRPLLAKVRQRKAANEPNAHVIMLASAMPGEGKTFTALNLAFNLTREPELHILLVDGDVPKPHISKLLGVSDEPGLMDALKNPTLDVESLILGTDIPNLSILPAGHRSENASELLGSERMRQVVARLAESDPRRIVLFDSPPLLLTTESQVLAQSAGEILVVVRADSTPRQVVLDALAQFDAQKSVSLVLNQSTRLGLTDNYYGYSPVYGTDENAPVS